MKNLLRAFSKNGRKIFLGAALCGVSASAFASHLMGGELIVTKVPGGGGFYAIQLTHYRDTLGIPLGMSNSYQIIAADASGQPVVAFSSGDLNMDSAQSGGLLSGAYGIEVGVYVDTVQLPPNTYWITTTNCCRNAAIGNMTSPGGESLSLITQFTATPANDNTTPYFLVPPVPYFPLNVAATYNPMPYDAEGDSLVWTLNVPKTDAALLDTNLALFGNPVAGFTAPPSNPINVFTMNPATGEINWTPNMLGNFVQSFLVDEYRGGVKIGSVIRDYQYMVLPADTNALPRMTPTAGNVQYNSATNSYYAYYTPGQRLSFSVGSSVNSVLSSMDMTAYSALMNRAASPAQFSYTTSGTLMNGTFGWTPAATETGAFGVVVRARNGSFSRDYTVVLKPNPTPTAVASVKDAAMEAKLYPNPTTGAFSVEAAGAATVRIFNNMGQQVDVVYEGAVNGKTTFTYNKPLAKGLYFVRIADAAGNVKALPLSVQ